jgi:hypothetical protein
MAAMNTIQTSLLALLALTLSMSLIADQADKIKIGADKQESVAADAAAASDAAVPGPAVPDTVEGADTSALASQVIPAASRQPAKSALDTPTDDTQTAAESAEPQPDGESVWADISDAITGLNDMVGDNMFKDLVRRNATTMEVRVDLDYWQRVRYETRVDLKNDISNIWHLYVKEYNQDRQSAVYFIDDRSGKTIDIFTQREKAEQ